MKASRLLSMGMIIAGGLAAARVLVRRHEWESRNRRMAICVDYDDATAAAIRAGISFDEMLSRLAAHGATHVSLPELTLERLLSSGVLAPHAPTGGLPAPRTGHWSYLGGEPDLLTHVAGELPARLPSLEARVIEGGTLAISGDLPIISELGLGFDVAVADRIRRHGLAIVPRPVSYAWPEKRLLERTLSQAAALGTLVAYAGRIILGHEMHLDETVAAMEREGLALVYFAESRHQKGDWFIAKKRGPHVVLAHGFTPEEMIPLDFHAACHNWVHLAEERGIRLCYVNFFRVLHATDPLEGLQYLDHLRRALTRAGFVVTTDVNPPEPIPTPETADLALAGLTAGGLAASAASELLDLPERLALPLVAAAAGGAAALPFLEQRSHESGHVHGHAHAALGHGHGHDDRQTHAHDHAHTHGHALESSHGEGHTHVHPLEPSHEEGHTHGHSHAHPHGSDNHGHHDHDHDHDHDHHDHHHAHHHDDGGHHHGHTHPTFSTSYAPKLLALATASLAPIVAGGVRAAFSDAEEPTRRRAGGAARWCGGLLTRASAAAVLSSVTSGREYHLRVEEYRGFGLDWLLPLAASGMLAGPRSGVRGIVVGGLVAGWMVAQRRQVDPLAQIDMGHPEGHTHHVSAAQRALGDLGMALGPRPARKWAGVGSLAHALGGVMAERGARRWATVAIVAGTLGDMLGLVGFRRPERALAVTAREALPSFTVGALAGLLVWLGSPRSGAPRREIGTPSSDGPGWV